MKDNLFNKKQLKKIILGLVIIVLAIMYSKTYVKYNIYNPKIDNSKWLQINSLKDNHIKQKFIVIMSGMTMDYLKIMILI